MRAKEWPMVRAWLDKVPSTEPEALGLTLLTLVSDRTRSLLL